MTSTRTQRILELSSSLSPTGAKTLLAMGLGDSDRPIDRVIRRLQAEDGQAWFESARNQLLDEVGVSLASIRSNPATPLEQLREHKAAIKRWSKDSDPDTQLIGVLGYFLVLAIASCHHSLQISDQNPAFVHGALRELEAALPAPWNCFVRKAISHEDTKTL